MISNRHSVTLLSVLTVLFLTTCKPEKEEPKPTTLASVITGEVTNTTTTTAKVGGQVVVDGNTAVTERGVVIGENTDPTIGDTKIVGGTGVGTFSVDLGGLTANTTYHVRAFATNAVGTSYGLDKSFTTSATIPTVTTTSISEITIFSSKGGGNITDDGGSAITSRGVCWSLNPNPTIADSVSVDGGGSGSYVSSLSKLNSNTTYYVRAYATNSVGTAYGPEISFSTPTSPIPTNGLVGWWPFNGNANDESGNGNNGVIQTGVTLTSDRFSNPNSAYTFNGLGFISLSTLPTTGSEDFTISAWILVANSPNPKGIICWGQDTPWASTYFFVSNDGYLQFDFAYIVGPKSASFIADSQWHLVSVTNYNGLMQLYVDGLPSGNSQQMSPNISGDNKAIGAAITNASNNIFSGDIDDVAVYNRALTAEEIQKIYNGTGF